MTHAGSAPSTNGQRPARVLGPDKPAPVESSRLETLPNTHELSLPETGSEEPRHARTKNLIYAEAAAKYVEEKLFLGSSNCPIDVLHGRALSSELGDREVRQGVIEQLRDKSRKPLGMSADAAALWQADQAEAFGMGNCGEQASVAFKYLLRHTDAKEVSVLSVGADHVLLAIGASPSELESATSGWSALKHDGAPQLPEQTVFCD